MENQESKEKKNERIGYVSQQWLITDEESNRSFTERLAKGGFVIAKGDRAKYVLIDQVNRKMKNLLKELPKGVEISDVETRIRKDLEHLPTSYEALGYSKENAEKKQAKYIEYMKQQEDRRKQKQAWLEARGENQKEERQPSIEQKEKSVNQQIQNIKGKQKDRDQSLER